VIKERFFTAFSNGFESSEVDNSIKMVFFKEDFESFLIANITIVEVRNNSENRLDSNESFFV
jgi:hypothetical protein